ncbi:MAG: ABC transporter ATP-binding protein, partial [Lysinibacillus sp.]
ILPELAEMCDELGVLDNGKLIAQGNVAAIQAQLQADKELIVKALGDLQKAVAFFEEDPAITSIQAIPEKETITFLYRGTKEQQVQLLKRALLADILIYSVNEVEKDLEDVFMSITKGAEQS